MAKRITPEQIKLTNRHQIYQYIYREPKVSQQEISYALRLSRPTVAANLAELELDGMVFRDGQQDSDQIGRKAVAYSVVADYRLAIGVEIMKKVVKIIGIDLYGNKLDRVIHEIEYRNEEPYYITVSNYIMDFIKSLGVSDEQILGVGFAIQGLVSPDGNTVVYGQILGCTGLTADVFGRHIPYPCKFIHDPDGAALAELWCSPEIDSAVYLSLSRHLGGSMIIDRKIVTGKHGHMTTFEHIAPFHGGELCYCGKRGCLETILSMKALIGDGDAEEFFSKVRSGEKEEADKWHQYLLNLALLIMNLHLIHDSDMILGGHLAPFFNEEDIRFMYNEIRKQTPFEEDDDFIHISKMPSHNINVGPALMFVRAFLEEHSPESDI
jgi:predicted NBD/HSP70 family sugar kinase